MDTKFIIWIALFWIPAVTCVFLAWYFLHRARHKERLMMMEKGIDPKANAYNGKRFSFPWAKFGIIIVGLSVGLIIISILVSFKALDGGGNALPLAILGICGGASMILANRLDHDKNRS